MLVGRVTASLLVAFALVCSSAVAQETSTGSSLSEAAQALSASTVYVDPQAERAISEEEAERLRSRIRSAGAGPLRIAILPAEAADEAGGDPSAALGEIANEIREPGTYAAVIGSSFQAGSAAGDLPPGTAAGLVREALEAKRAQGTSAVLLDFADRLGDVRRGDSGSGGGPGGGEGGIGGGALLLLLLGIPAAMLGVGRLRRRRREREQLEEVKAFAREDLVALGQDIRALDLDVEMPGIDPAAKADYNLAVERYGQADDAWDRAGRVEDMEGVASLLEEGRYAMTAAKARLDGREVPERSPPCFFDPRHGPSAGEAEWAPPGGSPRPVPVCAADLQRIGDGLDPQARNVTVNGHEVPYWNAGPAYMPWAGGFFGGGLLPGLFIGSMLGGSFGLFGGGFGSDAMAAEGGDFGTGDFGGLDDIGGGDFGGGDFGGGDF